MLSANNILSARIQYKLLICVTGAVGLFFLLHHFAASPLRNTIPHVIGFSSGLDSSSIGNTQNSTLGFQRIFTVNLPERTDHRDGLTLAATLSGLTVDFVDGLHPADISSKTVPKTDPLDFPPGALAAWRAHVNVLWRIVYEGITTALIVEDDVDWDIRLKALMHDVALSTNTILQHPSSAKTEQSVQPLDFSTQLTSKFPSTPDSPYGASWDVLWLGHCGMTISDNRAHVAHYNDMSVPIHSHSQSWDAAASTPLLKYPNHTREFGYIGPNESTCSLAYAVTQAGARKLLWEIGMTEELVGGFDIMLRKFCDKAAREEHGSAQSGRNTCLGVLPQLFDQYRPAGSKDRDSDITSPEGLASRPKSFTLNIRWSVRINIENLLRGATSDWIDQWPDT